MAFDRQEIKEQIIDLLELQPPEERKRLLEDVIRSLAYRYKDKDYLSFFPAVSEKSPYLEETVLLDYDTVAAVLCISVKTVQRLVKRGLLVAVNPGKKGVRITAGSLKALVKRGIIPIEARLEL